MPASADSDRQSAQTALQRIRILPDRLANLIAAGEVVERPSAVVKELVENALDADAGIISVELTSGGRRLIQITDDGVGMSPDDAVLAIERHATSKIVDTRDLDAIASYGFRGEALPSIASVSRFRLQTCHDEDGIGTEVAVDGGKLVSVKQIGRARGTTVAVRDLFYNTPARRKFLRTDQTELRHCSREVTGLALGAASIGFRLTHAGREMLRCNPARSWQERAGSIFGREMLDHAVELDAHTSVGRVYGLLGRPGDAGGGYREQYLLVNGRLVQARMLRKAVLDGFEATIESGNQPFFVVFLEIDPSTVDVNVHPQKREVRFRNEREIYGLVRESISQAFSGSGTTPARKRATQADEPAARGVGHFFRDAEKTFSRISERGGTYGGGGTLSAPRSNRPQPPLSVEQPERPLESLDLPADPNTDREETAAEEHSSQLRFDVSEPSAPVDDELPRVTSDSRLWQFQNKYIFASTDDGLWIVDQHAAHERILYEEAMAAFDGEEPASQRLLFPVTVELTPEQDAAFDEALPMLEKMGFDLERMSGRSVMVNAYPISARNWSDGNLLREMIGDIAEIGFRGTKSREDMATSYSCRAAVKTGEPLTAPKMRWLIETLLSTSMPYVCPHGRPVIVRIGLQEFDRRFGRS